MKGTVLGFDTIGTKGAVSGEDGQRYDFVISAWKANIRPVAGMQVDFKPEGNTAADIYLLKGYKLKSRLVAFVLAVFLGGFGTHKFYLRRYLAGVIYLLFCWTLVPSIIALVEGVLYLTKSDTEFNAKYVN